MQAISQNLNWYIIYTRPRYEKKIYFELIKKDIETFLPLQKVIRQWNDRKKKVEVPLFPSYLFVRIPISYKSEISKVHGVVRFLHTGQILSTISETEIMTIRIALKGNPKISTESYFKGSKVRISSGPLSGLQGTLVDQKGNSCLLIRINSMDKNLLVDIPASNVSKV